MVALFVLLLSGQAPTAGEEASLEEVQRRNAQLEERVRRLESAQLETAIEDYLASNAASGADSILPGGLALRFSGEVRVRGEIQHHLYSPEDAAGERSFDLVRLRTRLRVDVDVTDNVGAIVELQDVRLFGEEGSTIADSEGLDLKRGTIIVKKIGGEPLSVELGRFVMHYGDQRIIGHLEWVDQGRTYDGLRLHYQPERWWLDLFAVRVRETTPPVTDDDQWMAGLYGGRGCVEAYALLFSDDKPAMGELLMDGTRFVTLGARLHRTPGPWDYTGEVTVQTGEVRGDDLDAVGVALKGGYTFAEAEWRPRVGLEVDLATGDDNPADGRQKGLQTLFPTNHGHYGFADLVGWNNLLDLRLTASARPCDSLTVTLDFHHFRRLEERGPWVNAAGALIRPGLAGSDRHLGDEIDLTFTWKPRKGLSLLFGYSLFLPGGFVAAGGSDPVAHFVYLQTSVGF